jgi:hypothetical protein
MQRERYPEAQDLFRQAIEQFKQGGYAPEVEETEALLKNLSSEANSSLPSEI